MGTPKTSIITIQKIGNPSGNVGETFPHFFCLGGNETQGFDENSVNDNPAAIAPLAIDAANFVIRDFRYPRRFSLYVAVVEIYAQGLFSNLPQTFPKIQHARTFVLTVTLEA